MMLKKKNRVLVYGASGHGKVVLDTAQEAGMTVLGYVDDNEKKRGTVVAKAEVVAIGIDECIAFCEKNGASIAMGIGSNSIRKKVFEKLLKRKISIVTVIHPKAVVSSSAVVSDGTVIFAGAVINSEASIGQNVIVNTGACIDHDCLIGDHSHISPGVHVGGTVEVGKGTHIGIGSSIKNNVNIGGWSVLGAGSVVVKDIPARVVAYGVPAQVIHALEL